MTGLDSSFANMRCSIEAPRRRGRDDRQTDDGIEAGDLQTAGDPGGQIGDPACIDGLIRPSRQSRDVPEQRYVS